MFFRRGADSRELSGGAVVLKSKRPRSRLSALLLVVAATAGVGAAGAWYLDEHFVPLDRFERLAEEKRGLEVEILSLEHDARALREAARDADEIAQSLRDELERKGLDLQIGMVTRLELERQIIVLNEQLKQVQEELEFMQTAGGESR